MKVFRTADMREADRLAPGRGVPLAQLMARAGRGTAGEAVRAFPRVRDWHVLAGPGNNGGDGWVVALALLRSGRPARVWELPGKTPAHGPAAGARAAFLQAGGHVRELTEAGIAGLVRQLEAEGSSGGVIDALLGSGLSRPLTGAAATLVAALNRLPAPVVAVDVPSGLDSDVALPPGPFLQADLTVVLAGFRPAHLFEPACSACGRTLLLDIGFPPGLPDECSGVRLLQPRDAAAALPRPAGGDHKYVAGTVCLVAGSVRYRGAAELAARGAWRSGAGLVTLVSDGTAAGAWPETIFKQHGWDQPWPPPQLDKKRAAALVVGPGLPAAALRALPAIVDWAPGAVVLDATALDPVALAGLDPGDPPLILTPHAGEAGRLLQHFQPGQAGLVAHDPLAAAALLACELSAIIVLKGSATVIAHPDGRRAVSAFGHPAMASGGTGDVLAGVIGAFLARESPAEKAFARVCAAVVLHGLAGEAAAAARGAGSTAADVADALPAARAQLEGCRGAHPDKSP